MELFVKDDFMLQIMGFVVEILCDELHCKTDKGTNLVESENTVPLCSTLSYSQPDNETKWLFT